MNDSTSTKEQEELLFSVAGELKPYTIPSLTTIIGAPDEKEGDLIGSGTFIKAGDRCFLVTATHVMREALAYKYPAFSIGNARHPMLFSKPIVGVEFPEDVTIAEIDPSDLSGTAVVPFDISVFADSSEDLGDDILFIHGFPGKNSRFLAMGNGIFSESLPYATFAGDHSISGFNPAVHFAIQYKPEKQKNEHGVEVDLPPPPGLSGTAVWKAGREGATSEWQPSMARVVGIAHSWDQPAGSLIATRVEVLKKLIKHAIDRR